MPNPPVIAVVDDDEAMRLALSELVEVLSLTCRDFDRAEAFLAAYEPQAFDCLITDLSLPGLGGLELQRKLRALGSSLPIIVVTAASNPMLRTRALADGAFAYLEKPVKDRVLVDHIMSALREGKAQA